MIEEIKRALEETNLVRGVAGVPSAEKDEWLRYLIEHYEECRDDAVTLHKQVEELQQIIETAVMFLQSNELHVKAEQIKAMVKKGLNHEIR